MQEDVALNVDASSNFYIIKFGTYGHTSMVCYMTLLKRVKRVKMVNVRMEVSMAAADVEGIEELKK
jgi:hypothetical protein